MRTLELENVQLHWRQDGDPNGEPIVFANSLGTDLRMWDDLLPHLPSDARLIRFDLRGQGLTKGPPCPFSLSDLAMDFAGLLDRLRIGNCTLVGTSLGGMIAQQVAATRADLVRHLVLTNTAPKMGSAAIWNARIEAIRREGLAAIADDILDRWFAPSFRGTSKADFWRQTLIQADPTGYIAGCQAIADTDLTAQLGHIFQRTLIVGGEYDRASPPEQVEDMAQRIENSTCHILSDVGHLPSIEAPRILASRIKKFMSEVSDA